MRSALELESQVPESMHVCIRYPLSSIIPFKSLEW